MSRRQSLQKGKRRSSKQLHVPCAQATIILINAESSVREVSKIAGNSFDPKVSVSDAWWRVTNPEIIGQGLTGKNAGDSIQPLFTIQPKQGLTANRTSQSKVNLQTRHTVIKSVQSTQMGTKVVIPTRVCVVLPAGVVVWQIPWLYPCYYIIRVTQKSKLWFAPFLTMLVKR